MVYNSIAAAARHLANNLLYTAISVFGLAVGLWAALLAGLVLHNQFSFDHFIPGYDRIYMAMSFITPPGHATLYLSSTNNFVGPQLKLAVSEIDAVTRLAGFQATLRHSNVEAQEWLYWADPNAFDLLPLPTLAGNLKSALQRPDSIVLSRRLARKYFGRDAPLGESLLLDGIHPMTVRAVIQDLPVNGTHLQSDIFASDLAAWSEIRRQDGLPGNGKGADVGFGINTYLRLAPGASPAHLLAAMPSLAQSFWSTPPPGWKLELHILRMDRLNADPGLNPAFANRVIMMLVLGVVILIIATVNFVNLLTARSTLRATEVAIRKVFGAPRSVLMLQFLGESLVYVAVAAILAMALTEWSLPYANAFLGTGATFDYWRNHALIAWIALATILLSLFAGAYPAFVLSAFRPLHVLKGTARHLRSAGLMRQSLVTLQFAILIGLLVAAGVVYEQRDFATHDALRLDTDQMLVIRAPCNASYTTQLRKLPGVLGVACSSSALLGSFNIYLARDRQGVLQFLPKLQVDPRFFDLYGIRPLAGRFPPEGSATQGASVVVNESASRRLGFTSVRDILGFGLREENGHTVEVRGVVPDFSLDSVEQKIDARVYEVLPAGPDFNLVNVKLTGHDIPETLSAIDRLSAAIGGKQPVSRMFLNDYLQTLYVAMLREAQAFGIFSIVAVLLACLGLLGLSASITQRRTREIGIRKAMGADTSDVVRLLLWQFSKPVLWANLLAWPTAGYLMNRWLHHFAYHTDLHPWLFVVAMATAIVIALLTVSAHSMAVAGAKPVAALRYE